MLRPGLDHHSHSPQHSNFKFGGITSSEYYQNRNRASDIATRPTKNRSSMSDSRLPQEFSEQERSSLHSRSSHDSDDSLTALELHGRAAPTGHRGRSFSGSSFGFERDLLPLSASLSEPDEVRSVVGDKSIGLINGTSELASRQKLDSSEPRIP